MIEKHKQPETFNLCPYECYKVVFADKSRFDSCYILLSSIIKSGSKYSNEINLYCEEYHRFVLGGCVFKDGKQLRGLFISGGYIQHNFMSSKPSIRVPEDAPHTGKLFTTYISNDNIESGEIEIESDVALRVSEVEIYFNLDVIRENHSSMYSLIKNEQYLNDYKNEYSFLCGLIKSIKYVPKEHTCLINFNNYKGEKCDAPDSYRIVRSYYKGIWDFVQLLQNLKTEQHIFLLGAQSFQLSELQDVISDLTRLLRDLWKINLKKEDIHTLFEEVWRKDISTILQSPKRLRLIEVIAGLTRIMTSHNVIIGNFLNGYKLLEKESNFKKFLDRLVVLLTEIKSGMEFCSLYKYSQKNVKEKYNDEEQKEEWKRFDNAINNLFESNYNACLSNKNLSLNQKIVDLFSQVLRVHVNTIQKGLEKLSHCEVKEGNEYVVIEDAKEFLSILPKCKLLQITEELYHEEKVVKFLKKLHELFLPVKTTVHGKYVLDLYEKCCGHFEDIHKKKHQKYQSFCQCITDISTLLQLHPGIILNGFTSLNSATRSKEISPDLGHIFYTAFLGDTSIFTENIEMFTKNIEMFTKNIEFFKYINLFNINRPEEPIDDDFNKWVKRLNIRPIRLANELIEMQENSENKL
jgi:hypothetical protein